MTIQVEQEFSERTTDDLMKAYANAIETASVVTQEMVQKAETTNFRAARLRLDLCHRACDDLREALFLRLARKE